MSSHRFPQPVEGVTAWRSISSSLHTEARPSSPTGSKQRAFHGRQHDDGPHTAGPHAAGLMLSATRYRMAEFPDQFHPVHQPYPDRTIQKVDGPLSLRIVSKPRARPVPPETPSRQASSASDKGTRWKIVVFGTSTTMPFPKVTGLSPHFSGFSRWGRRFRRQAFDAVRACGTKAGRGRSIVAAGLRQLIGADIAAAPFDAMGKAHDPGKSLPRGTLAVGDVGARLGD